MRRTGKKIRNTREMSQMGTVIYENLKGFMLPRRGSISDTFNQKTVWLLFPAGTNKEHHDKYEGRTSTAENCRDPCALDIPL